MGIPNEPTLVETFGVWANAANVERFWGIAVAGDGRPCLLLPTAGDPQYRAVLITARGRIWIVMGLQSDGYKNVERDLGPVGMDPGCFLSELARWLMEQSRYALGAGNGILATESAHLAWRIYHYLGAASEAGAALQLKLNSISP